MQKIRGFTLIETLIALAAVVILGLIGWRIYDSRHNDQSTKDTTATTTKNSQNSTANSTSKTTSDSTQTDPNQGYVVIKEWGVRFKPVEGLEGVEYAVRPVAAEFADTGDTEVPAGSEKAAFTTAQLVHLSPNCDVKANDIIGVGAVQRSTSSIDVHAEWFIKEISGHYYYYYGPQSVCGYPDTTELHQASRDRLRESLRSLEPAQ